ncbi:MAG TPA: hypothetical protein VFT50_03825 [Baekduia sp.]|nr:hypothetical protein [Baekduia sp.]
MGADDAAPREAALAARVRRLEALVEALQDQVHRESERHDREIAELGRQLRPEAIARSLSDDRRRRGL